MNVLIVCAVGMSSSALTQKTREYLREKGMNDIKVGSCGSSQASSYAMQADLIILAPQISYLKENLTNNGYTRVLIMRRSSYGELEAEQLVDMVLHPDQYEGDEEKSNKQLQKAAELIGTNKILRSITSGMQDLLPVSVFGSIITLIRSFPVEAWTAYLDQSPLGLILDNAQSMTLGLMSLYLCMQMSYHLTKEHGGEGTGAGIAALVCFFIAAGVTGDGYFDITYLGSRGLFCAILVTAVTSEIFAYIQKHSRQNENSRLPKEVASSFRSILPSLVCIAVTLVVCSLTGVLLHTDFPEWIENSFSKPLTSIAGTGALSYLIMLLIGTLLWFVGLHGGQITNSLSMANLEAKAAGKALKYMVVSDVNHLFIFGGAGSTLALAILMASFAKSRKLRGVGKLAVPMGIFFINEPVIFGIPIVLNPLLLIPFAGIPAVSGFLTFTMMKIGILPYPAGLLLPWTTPPVVWGFLQGGWRLALWQVIMLAAQMFMWYPFFVMADRQELAKEKDSVSGK